VPIISLHLGVTTDSIYHLYITRGSRQNTPSIMAMT